MTMTTTTMATMTKKKKVEACSFVMNGDVEGDGEDFDGVGEGVGSSLIKRRSNMGLEYCIGRVGRGI